MALAAEARAWLADLWSPVVMVMASPELDNICLESNGLRFVDILRPFGPLPSLNGDAGVPIRTVAEHSFRLRSWRVRFRPSDKMNQVPADVADAFLKVKLHEAADIYATSKPPSVQELIQTSGKIDPTPWFSLYRDAFFRLQSFGEHEMMDYPVACMLALPSSTTGDFVSAFENLYKSAPHPSLLDAGVMDSRVLRYYIIVHDRRLSKTEDLERAELALSNLASKLGSTCNLLVIGHGNGMDTPISESFWTSDEPPEETSTRAEGRLAVASGLGSRDIETISAFVREMAVRSLIPMIEGKIRALNHQVSISRKGLKNQLKSFLWRKTGSGPGDLSGDPGNLAPLAGSIASGLPAPGAPHQYASTSLVSEMRQLADLALMVGDTETALGTLKLVASDFKAERAQRHYAAALEAIGVSSALAGLPAVDAAATIKDAFYRYSQLVSSNAGATPASAVRVREATRSATRAALLAMVVLRGGGASGDAGYVAMKAHFQEDNLRAGLLLEQAAHCLLAREPAQSRKFAFHLVLGALRYKLCDQLVLARRTYRQVLDVYSGRGWSFVEEHLHDALGKYARERGDVEEAAVHAAAMLDCPHASPQAQSLYIAQLREVVASVRRERGGEPSLALPVPRVSGRLARLHVDERICKGPPGDASVSDGTWQVLETSTEPLQQPGNVVTWLDAPGAAISSSTRFRACVNERIVVEVPFTNPLRVDLSISNAALVCIFKDSDDARDDASLLVEEEAMLLRGGQRTLLRLSVTALRPGRLSIDGVRWLLDGDIHGYTALDIPQPRQRKPGSSVVRLDVPKPPPGGFSLSILAASPRAEIELSGLAPFLLAGELARCSLRVRNTSTVPMRSIKFSSTSPLQLSLKDVSQTVRADAGRLDSSKEPGVVTFAFFNAALEPGSSIELNAIFWPASPGETVFNLLAAYESATEDAGFRWRCARRAWAVTVRPSLSLHLAAVPAMLDPKAYFLQLGVRGMQERTAIRLDRVQAVGSAWRLASLSKEAPRAGPLVLDSDLAPRANASFHCSLVPGPTDDSVIVLSPDDTDLLGAFLNDTSGLHLLSRVIGSGSLPLVGSQSRPSVADPTFGLLLRWTIPARPSQEERVGYQALLDQRVKRGTTLRTQLVGPGCISHDFASFLPALIQLTLRVFNASEEETDITIDLGRSPIEPTSGEASDLGGKDSRTWSPRDGGLGAPRQPAARPWVAGRPLEPCAPYVWVGSTVHSILHVPPGSMVEFPLEIAVSSPGVFEIADYAVAWSNGRAPGSPLILDVHAR